MGDKKMCLFMLWGNRFRRKKHQRYMIQYCGYYQRLFLKLLYLSLMARSSCSKAIHINILSFLSSFSYHSPTLHLLLHSDEIFSPASPSFNPFLGSLTFLQPEPFNELLITFWSYSMSQTAGNLSVWCLRLLHMSGFYALINIYCSLFSHLYLLKELVQSNALV